MNNRNIQSGMMPARKENMSKKFEAHQQNVQAHQAPVMSFHDVWNYDKCSDKKHHWIHRTYRHAMHVVIGAVSSRCRHGMFSW